MNFEKNVFYNFLFKACLTRLSKELINYISNDIFNMDKNGLL